MSDSIDRASRAFEVRDSDLLVVGSGVAGLVVALGSQPLRVTLVSKSTLESGSSPLAQGGLAAAVSRQDSASNHAQDTLRVGRGLSLPAVVEDVTGHAAQAVQLLLAAGARFDRDRYGRLELGREGGHGQRRILHAGGDATGAELVRALKEAVLEEERIEVEEGLEVIDLDVDESSGRILGAWALRSGTIRTGHDRGLVLLRAPRVVLATGGIGQIYGHTTNPPENTGDGWALAARAGAALVDLEFVQFHPTAFLPADHKPGERLPLLSEALRGEGALVVDSRGRRFLEEAHRDAELAPRDVVAREIFRRRSEGLETYLDLRPLAAELEHTFPTASRTLARAGLDPGKDLVPIAPAAHYAMGGVAVDALGRSSVEGLWACGEVASTGLHGANRLASNSLLEACVCGQRVASDVVKARFGSVPSGPRMLRPPLRERSLASEDSASELGGIMDRWVSVERDGEGLRAALGAIQRLEGATGGGTENRLLVARLIATAALAREESRGSHQRRDFPETLPAWQRRLVFRLDASTGSILPVDPERAERAEEAAAPVTGAL